MNRKRLAYLLVIAALLGTLVCMLAPGGAVNAPAASAEGDWVMVWNDEFDGPDVDTTKWNIVDAPDSVGNNSLHYAAPDDVYIENGMLVLRQQDRDYPADCWYGPCEYTAGKVTTRNKMHLHYGKVEIRSHVPGLVPNTDGLHSALWLLSPNCLGYGGGCGYWPPEIDIVEVLGNYPNVAHMSYHWGLWPDNSSRTYKWLKLPVDQFHVYAVEWEPTEIRWYIDGVERAAHSRDLGDADQPMMLIMDTVVGGNWPGDPTADTIFPSYHYIDYVRVYVRPGSEWTPTPTIDPNATDTPAPTATATPYGGLFTPVDAVASSVEGPSYVAANAIDGDPGTRWASDSAEPEWIYVDLGESKSVTRVILNWEAAYGEDYEIQVSDNASDWTTIRSEVGGNGGVDDLTGLSGTGRYVRMYGTKRGSAYGFSLWEFEVYGEGGGASPTPEPTDTPVPPTDTPEPTDTPVPTNTPGGPTDTPVPPTDTPLPTNTPGSGANLALGQPTEISSYNSADNMGDKAVDADLGTWWRTFKYKRNDPGPPSEYITVDLGSSHTISQVVLEWYGSSFYATDYTIQVSPDNSAWTTVATVSGENGNTDTINFSATSARYVKLETTAWENEYERNWLKEFEIYE